VWSASTSLKHLTSSGFGFTGSAECMTQIYLGAEL